MAYYAQLCSTQIRKNHAGNFEGCYAFLAKTAQTNPTILSLFFGSLSATNKVIAVNADHIMLERSNNLDCPYIFSPDNYE